MAKQWGQERLAYEIGMKIQSRNRDAWGTWSDWEDNERPYFLEYGNWEYRIKPKEAEMAHKWETEMDAYIAGKQIQFRFNAGANAGWGGWVDIAKPAFHTEPDFQYRVKPEEHRHPHADLIIAWANGAKIQREYLFSENVNGTYVPAWQDDPSPKWLSNVNYRIKPVSEKWAKEKEAYNEGQTIQWRQDSNRAWRDANKNTNYIEFRETGCYESYEYRIKPAPKPDLVIERHLEVYGSGITQGVLHDRSMQPNIRYTFDPDTKELKQVELLK